jgi:hypothetical protein
MKRKRSDNVRFLFDHKLTRLQKIEKRGNMSISSSQFFDYLFVLIFISFIVC